MASEGIATILANSTSPELQAKAERLRALFEDNAVPERSPKHFRPEKVEMKLALKHLLWTTLHRNAWCSGAKRPPWPILKVTSNHSSKECPSPLLIMSENLHATSDFLDDLFSDRPKNNPSTHTNWKGGAPQGLSTLVCDDIQTDDICLVRSSSPTLKTAELLDRSSPPPLTHPDLDPLRVSSPLLKITDGRSDATSERASSPPMSGEQLQRITLFEESSLFLENDEEEEEEKGCDDMIDVVTCLDDEETVGGKADILDRSSSPIRLDDDDDLCQELPTSQSLWHM
ncbi:hypothetical protein KEM55_006532 [Ascosphaera atra]|nr:hypothetical protein KEM55_006532 [Ascosphaera atra]